MVETAVLKSTVIQVGVCLLANCALINSGMVIGFPSNMRGPLESRGETLQQVSWACSICFVSAPVASLLAGPLLDQVGRTRSLQFLNITFMVGWLLLAKTPYSMPLIYAGRLFGGLGMGLAACCAATYTAEVSSSNIRTPLVTMSPIMLAVGTFLVYLGALIFQDSWTQVSYFGAGLSTLIIALSHLLPESPLWLVSRGRTDDASRQLMVLRGASLPEQVSNELHDLTSRAQGQQPSSSWFDSFNSLRRPEAFKPLLIINVFFMFQQLSGVGIVMLYAVDFTRDAGIPSQAYTVALSIAAMRMFSALITTWACSLYGRRSPALLTGLIMSLSILVLSYDHPTSPWLSGFLILLYVLSSSIGFSSLPWSMLGELFPTSVRGLASGITTAMVFFMSFFGAQLYPYMVAMFGSRPIFVFFGMSGLVGTYFLYRYLPETHGKTLAEIEDYFKEVKHQKEDMEMGVVNKGFSES